MNQHFSLQRGERAAPMPVMPDLPTGVLPLQHRERPAGSRLFDLGQLDVRWEAETGSLWTFMTPIDRPNFNRPMLRDFQRWQEEIRREFAAPAEGLKYLVLGSRFPGIFNLGVHYVDTDIKKTGIKEVDTLYDPTVVFKVGVAF